MFDRPTPSPRMGPRKAELASYYPRAGQMSQKFHERASSTLGWLNGSSALKLVFAVHVPYLSVTESVYFTSSSFFWGVAVSPNVRPAASLAV
eukprot:scaffold192849_cov32-Tisochrysis_lutea.AAC.3